MFLFLPWKLSASEQIYLFFIFIPFFFAEDPPFFPRHDPALRSLSLFFFLHVASSFRFDIFFIHQKVLRAMRKETRLNYNVIGKGKMRNRPIKILATIESMDVIIKYQSVDTGREEFSFFLV